MIISFGFGFWAGLRLGGWLCHHLLLSAQSFQPLDIVAVGLGLPWLHPEGLCLTAVLWGPCWWIKLAGDASFTHVLTGATHVFAP